MHVIFTDPLHKFICLCYYWCVLYFALYKQDFGSIFHKLFEFEFLCRKKRKWDQPAESLMPVGMTVPGALPLSNAVTLGGVAFPAMAPVISGTLLTNPLAASAQLPQHAAAAAVAAQKLNQVSVRLLISYGVSLNILIKLVKLVYDILKKDIIGCKCHMVVHFFFSTYHFLYFLLFIPHYED